MPLWYVVRDGTLWAWTYGKSQKVVNLRRDPRATLQVEAGQGQYDQLRGIMIEADCVLHDDLDTVAGARRRDPLPLQRRRGRAGRS